MQLAWAVAGGGQVHADDDYDVVGGAVVVDPAPIPTASVSWKRPPGELYGLGGQKTDDWGLAGGVANEPWPVPPCL